MLQAPTAVPIVMPRIVEHIVGSKDATSTPDISVTRITFKTIIETERVKHTAMSVHNPYSTMSRSTIEDLGSPACR